MKLMIPLVPHIAHECLSNLKCVAVNEWPKIDKTAIAKSSVKLVVQINGKTRDVLEIKKDLNENDINKLIKNSAKANKYLVNNKVIKTIFVKNKIINYIIANK
jgi:leucyl-tRNA synthetase